MKTAPYAGAVPDLGTSEVARVVGMDPNLWAYTAMKDVPGHVAAIVMVVMDTAFKVDAVQRQLLDDAARVVQDLSKTLTGTDTIDQRATVLLGDRGTRIEHLAIRRGDLLRQLDTHLAIYQEVVAESKPPAPPQKALGCLTHPADTLPQARTARR